MPGAADDFAELREDIEEILEEVAPDLCTIEQQTLVPDGHSGKQQQWASAGEGFANLPCIAYPNAKMAHVVGAVPTAKTVYSVLVKGGVAVTSKMRVRVHARAPEPERIVEIKNVLPALGVIVEIVGLVSI